MVAMALYSGNRRRAHAALKAQGISMPETTLGRWGDTQSDWYQQVKTKIMPRIREQAAERRSELADIEGELNRRLLARMEAEYQDIPVTST